MSLRGRPERDRTAMPSISSSQLRSHYLDFFVARGHAAIASAPLVPAGDPTVLFTTAGMHPLVPYLLGEPHPAGARLVSVQECLRTGDIDVVGDDSHLTWFEMLGNWSLGDYGRDESIAWSFEFLTEVLGLPLDRLGATCFAGDEQVPADRASVAIWRRLGVPEPRIALLGRDDNWWGPAGDTGPCGPDTEIFFWVGDGPAPEVLDVRDRRWVEIWNNVFMTYTRTAAGDIVPLARGCVDTGMGVERTVVALNGLRSVYEIDTVKPLLDELRGLSASPHERELRALTDHMRAACFVIADGVALGNKDRGYVLRRLVRRGIVFARRLGLPPDWIARAVAVVPRMLGDAYPEVARDPGAIVRVITDEARRFERTLAHGLRMLERRSVLDGQAAFDLQQTHGLPFELTREIALAAGTHIDEADFRRALEVHRERSRAGSGMAGRAQRGAASVPIGRSRR
jgi:alanyl-tRNA synthetase